MTTLRLVMGDQLSLSLPNLQECDLGGDIVFMCEVWDEATVVRHHKKKIAFIFSAMRHFAQDLRAHGYQVDYVELEDEGNSGSFRGEVERALTRHDVDRIAVTFPSEYRVLKEVESWPSLFACPVDIMPDDRFLCDIDDFTHWARGRKQLRMEFFYREMRKKHDILMQGDQPIGGEWNYDAKNRKSPSKGLAIPEPYVNEIDDTTEQVIKLVSRRFSDHFGDMDPFYFAVTREQALQALDLFVSERLPLFGDYQDAMIQHQPWMYHSHVSFYLNCGLLLPLECIKKAEQAYHDGLAPLNAVEGFIRQILGWREYVRGIYWMKMPDYAEQNFLEASRPLPAFYWTGETEMNCLSQCVQETKKHAYAHHIQRLMVLGNFALMAGVSPKEVNEWFFIVYADAFEWVELPNVSGMILFADGGLLASKPYAASGSYIHKMSNYCKGCRYKVTQKNGPEACPFNYLYWDFLSRNRDRLASNHRVAMMYRTYDRLSEERKQAIKEDSQAFLTSLS